MPKSAWSGRRMSLLCPLCPCRRALHRQADDVGRARQRWADVEDHLDVGADALLHVDRDLGSEAMRRAVVGALEGDPVVIDLGVEREHLESARVREREAVPSGEPAQATEALDEFGSGPQHEVIGVAEHDLRADTRIVDGAEVLDRSTGADRHEQRRRVTATSSRCRSGVRGSIAGFDVELDRVHSGDGIGERRSGGGASVGWSGVVDGSVG